MIKFKYELNEEGMVVKSIAETYPDKDILQKGISANRATVTIKNALAKAYEGLAEQPLVLIEEEWFRAQTAVQDLEAVVRKIDADEATTVTINGVPSPREVTLTEEEIAANAKTRTEIDAKLVEPLKHREALELKNEWLKSYRGVETTATRPAITWFIPGEDIKALIAHERNFRVHSLEDTVADLAKINTLLMSFTTAMYNVLPATQKNNIPAEIKAVIDHATQKWPETMTRGDRQLAVEGTALLDKLFAREVIIADIVDQLKAS